MKVVPYRVCRYSWSCSQLPQLLAEGSILGAVEVALLHDAGQFSLTDAPDGRDGTHGGRTPPSGAVL